VTQGDEPGRPYTRQYLKDIGVGNSEGIFWNMKCISLTTIIVPNILHTIYLGILKHLMDWVMSLLEHHSRINKFNQLWAMMSPYPGFARFTKPCSQVTQCSSNEMKALGPVIVPDFAATLFNPLASQRIPFTEALLCIKNLVYFHLWHGTGTILKPQSSRWKIIWRSFIVRTIFRVDSMPVDLDSRSRKPWNSSLLSTNRRNGRPTPLGTILLQV